MNEELKPCPFCGASGGDLAIRFTGYVEAPDITIDYYVHCFNCGAEIGQSMNAKYATKAWNRREPIGNSDELWDWLIRRIRNVTYGYQKATVGYYYRDGYHDALEWVLSLKKEVTP